MPRSLSKKRRIRQRLSQSSIDESAVLFRRAISDSAHDFFWQRSRSDAKPSRCPARRSEYSWRISPSRSVMPQSCSIMVFVASGADSASSLTGSPLHSAYTMDGASRRARGSVAMSSRLPWTFGVWCSLSLFQSFSLPALRTSRGAGTAPFARAAACLT